MDYEIRVDLFHTVLCTALDRDHSRRRCSISQVKALEQGPHIEEFPTGSFKYSPIVNVCFAEQSNEMLLGIFLWVVPIAFDVLLVALTTSKGYRNAVLLKRSFRSPIVRQSCFMVSKSTESFSPNWPSFTLCSVMG